MIDIISLWKEVTYKISGSLNSAAYSLWIDTLVPVCIKDSTLILKTPSQATRATLSTRYKEMIKDFVFETNN